MNNLDVILVRLWVKFQGIGSSGPFKETRLALCFSRPSIWQDYYPPRFLWEGVGNATRDSLKRLAASRPNGASDHYHRAAKIPGTQWSVSDPYLGYALHSLNRVLSVE